MMRHLKIILITTIAVVFFAAFPAPVLGVWVPGGGGGPQDPVFPNNYYIDWGYYRAGSLSDVYEADNDCLEFNGVWFPGFEDMFGHWYPPAYQYEIRFDFTDRYYDVIEFQIEHLDNSDVQYCSVKVYYTDGTYSFFDAQPSGQTVSVSPTFKCVAYLEFIAHIFSNDRLKFDLVSATPI